MFSYVTDRFGTMAGEMGPETEILILPNEPNFSPRRMRRFARRRCSARMVGADRRDRPAGTCRKMSYRHANSEAAENCWNEANSINDFSVHDSGESQFDRPKTGLSVGKAKKCQCKHTPFARRRRLPASLSLEGEERHGFSGRQARPLPSGRRSVKPQRP